MINNDQTLDEVKNKLSIADSIRALSSSIFNKLTPITQDDPIITKQESIREETPPIVDKIDLINDKLDILVADTQTSDDIFGNDLDKNTITEVISYQPPVSNEMEENVEEDIKFSDADTTETTSEIIQPIFNVDVSVEMPTTESGSDYNYLSELYETTVNNQNKSENNEIQEIYKNDNIIDNSSNISSTIKQDLYNQTTNMIDNISNDYISSYSTENKADVIENSQSELYDIIENTNISNTQMYEDNTSKINQIDETLNEYNNSVSTLSNILSNETTDELLVEDINNSYFDINKKTNIDQSEYNANYTETSNTDVLGSDVYKEAEVKAEYMPINVVIDVDKLKDSSDNNYLVLTQMQQILRSVDEKLGRVIYNTDPIEHRGSK